MFFFPLFIDIIFKYFGVYKKYLYSFAITLLWRLVFFWVVMWVLVPLLYFYLQIIVDTLITGEKSRGNIRITLILFKLISGLKVDFHKTPNPSYQLPTPIIQITKEIPARTKSIRRENNKVSRT